MCEWWSSVSQIVRTSCWYEGWGVLLLFRGTYPCLWCHGCVWEDRDGSWSEFDERRILRGLTLSDLEYRCLGPLSAWLPWRVLLIEGCGKSLKGMYWSGGKGDWQRKVQWVGEGWQRWLVGSEYVTSPFRAGWQPLSAVCFGQLEEKRKSGWRWK